MNVIKILLLMFGATVCIIILTSKDTTLRQEANELIDTMFGSVITILGYEYKNNKTQ